MSSSDEDENFVYACWKTSDEFLKNGYVEASIKILNGLCVTRKNHFDNSSKSSILEIKTRLRLSHIILLYTTELHFAQKHLQEAHGKINDVKRDFGKINVNDRLGNVRREEFLEIQFLHVMCLKSLAKTYFNLSSFGFAKKSLLKGIELTKVYDERVNNNMKNKNISNTEYELQSHYHYFTIEYLKLLVMNRKYEEFFSRIEDVLTDLEQWEKRFQDLKVIYSLIECQVRFAERGTLRNLEFYAKIEQNLNRVEKELSGLTNGRELNQKDRKYWLDNFDHSLMKLHFLTMKVVLFMEKSCTTEFKNAIIQLEPFMNLFHSVVSKRENTKQTYKWIHASSILALGYLLSAISHRSTGRIENAMVTIEKGLGFVNKRIDKVAKHSDGYILYPDLNEETLSLLSFQFLFLFNKILVYLGIGDFKSASHDIHLLQERLGKSKFLRRQYLSKLLLLKGIYFALMKKNQDAKKNFSIVIMLGREYSAHADQDSQIIGWAEIFSLAIDLLTYMENQTNQKLKNEIFNRLDALQKDQEYLQNAAVVVSLAFLKGTLCSTSDTSSGEEYLRHSLAISSATCKNPSFSARVLTVLGEIYAKTEATSTSNKCFIAAIAKQKQSQDLVAHEFTLDTMSRATKKEEDKKEWESKKKIAEDKMKRRIKDAVSDEKHKDLVDWKLK